MKWFDPAVLTGVVLALAASQAAPSADAVIAELKAGNAHHVAKKYAHPHQTSARQRELATGQHPHCALLTCADSRVAPEIVFDQGLGDIFDAARVNLLPQDGDAEGAGVAAWVAAFKAKVRQIEERTCAP